jgi:hypothetical protein
MTQNTTATVSGSEHGWKAFFTALLRAFAAAAV